MRPLRATFCADTGSHSFELTPMPVTRREEVPALLKNAAEVPSTVVFSRAGGVPLELMAPARGSAFLCAGGVAARIFVRIRSGTAHTDVNRGLLPKFH
ncbi:unnamed protein product, partial [Staurois parvus]